MSLDNRQELLKRWTLTGTAAQGFVPAPGSGATITIWDSGNNDPSSSRAVRFKRLIYTNSSSADSGASGVVFQESADNGTNWKTIVSYTDTAVGAPNIRYVSISFPRVRVTYTNSAAVLTEWNGSLVGDEYERASQ